MSHEVGVAATNSQPAKTAGFSLPNQAGYSHQRLRIQAGSEGVNALRCRREAGSSRFTPSLEGIAADGIQLALVLGWNLRMQAMLLETPSLLITDDDTGFRETLRVIFEPKGFRTLLAGDGEEALKIVHHETVHVVLLDMHMPKLTGLETLRMLKEFRAMLPCILLSAQLDDRLVEQARRAHAYSVLSKTVTVGQITCAVRQALQRTYAWHG
jgi:CheY-like chemotaxis protein